MSEYDVLFAVVLRISDYDGKGMMKKMDKATWRLGELINAGYEDCCIIPVGFDLVETEEDNLNILNYFEYTGNND